MIELAITGILKRCSELLRMLLSGFPDRRYDGRRILLFT